MSNARRPAGGWPSTLRAERVAAAGLRLSEPRLSAEGVHWLEGRPTEGGRVVPMLARFDALDRPEELAPELPALSARSRVNEYGGGAHWVSGESPASAALLVDHATQQILDLRGEALTPAGASRGDPRLSPDGRWLVCIEEIPSEGGGQGRHCVVAYGMDDATARADSRRRIVVAEGRDFYASPRFDPSGSRLAFIAWDHPSMPWDATELWELPWQGATGPGGAAQRLGGASETREAIVQPEYSPAGELVAATDRSGWWNLARFDASSCTPILEDRAEYAGPMWVLGLSHYAFVDDDHLLCALVRDGRSELRRISIEDPSSPRSEAVPLPFELGMIEGLRASGGRACWTAGGPDRALGVYLHDLGNDQVRELRSSSSERLASAWISVPEAIRFESAEGRTAHAFHYRPRNPEFTLASGEVPPLLVLSHGGPTSATHPVLDLRVQYWTSRGFAVLDVNYAGSTGYGRAYREALRGKWGLRDVEDCIAGARHLIAAGEADPERLAIAGGSAGGYTTLCALTFHDLFRAGASRYGIGDLETLARDTHKFEARYTDSLVGPYPEAISTYRARSPIHHVDRLSCPILFLQGLEDRVVPPNQAETMAAALDRREIPHALVTFATEGHGFRSQESIRRALECELAFFGAIFGFESDAPAEGLDLRRGAALGIGDAAGA